MKIAIIDQPLNNRGDQSAHKAFIKVLKDHSFKTLALFINNDINSVKSFFKDINDVEYKIYNTPKGGSLIKKILIRFPLLFHLIIFFPGYKRFCHDLKNSDVVVMAPGGANIGVYKSWSTLSDLYIALSFNKKVAIWGRSIGPLSKKTKSDRRFFKKAIEVIKQVGFISVRDKKSQDFLSSLDINYVETTDTAFMYTPQVCLPKELSYLKNKKYIVFVPHELCSWHPFFKDIDPKKIDYLYINIINKITSMGYKIVMLPQLFCRGIKGDFHYFTYLKQKVKGSDLDILSEGYDSDIQQVVVKNADAVIGARYHSIIFAINNLTPFISLSYEPKMYGILDSLDLKKYSIDLKNLVMNDDISVFFESIDNIIKSKKIIKNVLKEKKGLAKQIAFDAFEQFIIYVKNE